MKLYYFKDPEGNFGDDLNPWLWQNLLGDVFDQNTDELFVGVGTLLNHRIPKAKKVTVFGSGHGYGDIPPVNTHWQFYSVRGPLTAQALGLDLSLAITDPAILAPLFTKQQTNKKYPISYMPHCVSARNGDWQKVCQIAGIHYIDPRKPYLDVFKAIQQTELLLTEAMHGAILADAFRVHWLPVKAYKHISEYKWQDWLQSVKVETKFNHIKPVWRGDSLYPINTKLKHKLKRVLHQTPLWQTSWQSAPPAKSSIQQLEQTASQLKVLATSATPQLSNQTLFLNNQEKLLDKVRQFKRDHGI